MKVLDLFPTTIYLAKLQYTDGSIGHTPVLVTELGGGRRQVMTPKRGSMQVDPSILPLAREVNDVLDQRQGVMPNENFQELDIELTDPTTGNGEETVT